MNEHLSGVPSPIPDESSRSNDQVQVRPTDISGDKAPLHDRLPLEILCAIIHICIGFTTPVRDLVTLQLVCRSWYDIIADVSFLWGTINAAEGLPAVHKALHMTKGSPIDLNYIEKSSTIDQSEFFNLAREKIDQWRSFVVESRSRQWESALADLRTQKPPKLDTLHVVMKKFEPPRNEEIVLFGGEPASGLKDVRFVNVPISRASLQLSGLKSLRLEEISSVSAAEVKTLIIESPGLEILHLVSLDGAVLPPQATSSQPNLTSNSPIELVFLVELNLSYLNLPFLSHLLSTITFPQLRSLRVGCQFDENPALQLGATLGLNRLDPSINSIASGAQMYEVTLMSWDYYVFSIGGLDIDISFLGETSINNFLETFTWLSSHLEQSLHDLPLHLNLKNCDPEPSYFEWFTSHTNVTTLTLYNDRAPYYGPGLEEMIPILGRPTSSPPSPPAWLLPQVEVLFINLVWMEGGLAIVRMVEGRHAASRSSSAAEVNRAFPRRFREIRLAYGGKRRPPPDAGFVSKVVQVAEGADVYWEGKKWIAS